MICQILRPCLACFGSYSLAHSQHEGHTRWVLFSTKFFEYFIGRVGQWFSQAVFADVVEIEDARYFYTFSETIISKVVENEDMARWVISTKAFTTKVLTTLLPTHLCRFLLSALLINWYSLQDHGMQGYRQRPLRENLQTYIAHSQTPSCKSPMNMRPLA